MADTTNSKDGLKIFLADGLCAITIILFTLWAFDNSMRHLPDPYYYSTPVGITTHQYYVLESTNGITRSECILPSSSTLKTLRVVNKYGSEPLFETQFEASNFNSFNENYDSVQACFSGSFKTYITESQLLEFLMDDEINTTTTYPTDPYFNQITPTH